MRVSPPSTLEGSWIEIFRAGDYADRGNWPPERLDQLAASYNPRIHAAPVVLGHPADDAPAYAWVRRLRRAGQSLWAQLEKVDPAFEALLRAGRFAQRSVALYTRFPLTGGPYLRHLGFLGAAPPAVKGLSPVRPARPAGGFAEAASVTFAFDNQPFTEDAMSEPKSKLEAFLDHLRSFFTSEPESGPGRARACPVPSEAPAAQPQSKPPVTPSESAGRVEGSAFSERLAQLEQRLDALTAEKSARQEGLSQTQSARRQGQIANFVESLRARGRFPPAFDRWGVHQFMDRLAQIEAQQPSDSSSDAGLVHTNHPPRPTLGEGRRLAAADAASSPPVGEEVPPSRGPGQDAEYSPAVILSEAKELSETTQPSQKPLLSWFQEFLTRLPAVIEFRELTAGNPGQPALRSFSEGGRLVRFTEPRRGMTIDPASIELAERAEALAAELGISYADALARLREERRTTVTTA